LQWALKSWWTGEYNAIVQVLSDSDENEIELGDEGRVLQVPNLVNTECPPTYNFGLWCKDLWMLTQWREDPRFSKVKWFYRGMDDTWLHLENLVWLSRQYDHRKAIVIGEMVCESRGTYPDGGPGFLISRGVIDHPNALHAFHEALALNDPQPVLDDVIWGLYTKLNNVTLVHNNGISHLSHFAESETYQYFLHQQKTEKGWPLNFRPIAYHQKDELLPFMPEMDRSLKAIDFNQPSRDSYSTPGCYCRDGDHRRCSWDKPMYDIGEDKGGCRWASSSLFCLGPGPWPNSPSPVVDYSDSNALDQAEAIYNNILYLQLLLEDEKLEPIDIFHVADLAPKINKSWATFQSQIQDAAYQLTNPPRSHENDDQSIYYWAGKLFQNQEERSSILRFCLSNDITMEKLRSPSAKAELSQKFSGGFGMITDDKVQWSKLMAAMRRGGALTSEKSQAKQTTEATVEATGVEEDLGAD
jgi:hypothetical protein